MRHTALLTLFLTASSLAQGLDVAIVAAAMATNTDCRFTDAQALLLATGLFISVDIINMTLAPPTLAALAPHDAILT